VRLQQHADRAVDVGHVGIVIGAISAAGTEWAAAGSTGRRGRRPDDRTIFRLASLSKVFTATALASAVTTGDIALDEPVLHHITYRHLATHTAGLPQGGVGLLDALQAVPGAGFEYSNEGVAALGALLGPDYEAVIQERIGLPDVTTVLDAEQLGRLAPGHDENGRPVVTPTYPLGAPSGGLYGTTADLLVFVRQYLTPDAARRLAVTDRLCWMVDGERVSHNGALPGYRGYLAFCPVAGTGVAVLSNTAISVDDLGVDVLSGLRPTAAPATPSFRQAEASPEPSTPAKHSPGDPPRPA
jgi:CubicO group peptidase (beta-lactamase class C family)